MILDLMSQSTIALCMQDGIGNRPNDMALHDVIKIQNKSPLGLHILG